MAKTKEDHINDLVNISFKIDDALQRQQDKSDRLTRMAQLSKAGLKDTDEFRKLDNEFRHPQFSGPSEELYALRDIVKRLRKYKF